jgi:hypothetical protein
MAVTQLSPPNLPQFTYNNAALAILTYVKQLVELCQFKTLILLEFGKIRSLKRGRKD